MARNDCVYEIFDKKGVLSLNIFILKVISLTLLVTIYLSIPYPFFTFTRFYTISHARLYYLA
jgi:hypothetical protein